MRFFHFSKRFFLISFFVLFFLSEKSFAQDSDAMAAEQGRIIVLVIDVSQSIKNQLGAIIKGISDEIVEKRLRSGDYCVVIPLGDKSTVDSADSFGIRYSRDKEKILEYLSKLGIKNKTNLNTDIGAAMQKTFDFISMIDSESTGEMCEPLVLFITDGEIYQSPNSKETVLQKTPEEIFENPRTSPLLNSYSNWWFLGIENEGVPLEHIKKIAQGAGAFPERYQTLSDMEQFGALFDIWLSSIPDPKPRDKGGVDFKDFRFGGSALREDGKSTVVSTNSRSISWSMNNSFSRTNVVLKINGAEAIFQNEKTGEVSKIALKPEAGNIELKAGENRKTEAFADFPNNLGRGRLKLSFSIESTGGEAGDISEKSFFVEFKSPSQILFEKIALPVAIVLALILAILLFRFFKARAAVKVQLEIVGKSSKGRAVLMRVGKKADAGSKPSVDFRLEGNFAPVVLTLERTGSSSWKIVVKDSASVSQGQNLSPYKLGSTIKINSRDGNSVGIKFRQKRK